MAQRKRTAAERRLDLHIVAAGMALGWRDAEITRAVNADRARRVRELAEEGLRAKGLSRESIDRELAVNPPEVVEISRQQISYDKRHAEAILVELTQKHAREEIGRQLIRLDQVWSEAMAAWRESKEDAKEIIIRHTERPVKTLAGTSKQVFESKIIRTAPRAGDPRHLKVALEAIQERTDLLRLRERELAEKVSEPPQFDADEPATLDAATAYLEATSGSRFANHGRLRLVHPKQRHKR